MSKSPAFRFYPRDYLADPVVTCMTLEDQGAYMRLLCHAWDPPSMDGGEKPPVGHLPNDPVTLAALSGMGTQVEQNTNRNRWDERSAFILRAFHETEDGRFIYQKRMVEEWEKQEEYREAKSSAGKASGKARRTRDKQKRNKPRTETPTKTNLAFALAPAVLGTTYGSSPPDGAGEERPKPISLEDALLTLDRSSGGGYVYSAPNKGQSVTLQEYVSKHKSSEDWEHLGEYVKAVHAGRGWEPLGTPLLAVKIGDLLAKSERWHEANCPPLAPVRSGTGRAPLCWGDA